MNDLISRQALCEYALNQKDKSVTPNDIMRFPSAQPEMLTDDDFETIRIHLNAYKERLCNQHRWKEAEEYQRIIDRFMAFASAQSEIIKCKDCQYRQLINEEREELGYYCELDSIDPYEQTRGADKDDWFCADAKRKDV